VTVKSEFAVKNVTCPGCGGDSVYASTNSYRPFCSAHCKSIDLGAWASESFKVPVPLDPLADLDPDANFQDGLAHQGLRH
jgi:endogenous inhibitor of DNA gyrase (YacG/DUF329 family)